MQKTIFSLFISSVLAVPVCADVVKTKKDILQQLNLSEGQYEVIVPSKNAASFCEDEILKIEILEDKENVSLLIGANLVFAQINSPTISFESNVDCKTTQTNKIENKKLVISQNEQCTDGQKKSDSKVFQFDFKKGQVELSLNGGGQTTFCRYKKTKKNLKGK